MASNTDIMFAQQAAIVKLANRIDILKLENEEERKTKATMEEELTKAQSAIAELEKKFEGLMRFEYLLTPLPPPSEQHELAEDGEKEEEEKAEDKAEEVNTEQDSPKVEGDGVSFSTGSTESLIKTPNEDVQLAGEPGMVGQIALQCLKLREELQEEQEGNEDAVKP